MWACLAVLSAALCLVPVSIECMFVSGFIMAFAWRIRFRSLETIIAPSILQSSKSFWDVNLELILNPPSNMFWFWRISESKTIIAPRSDLRMSSITVLREVPGDTSFRKSRKVFSFSVAMGLRRHSCFYSFVACRWLREVFVRWWR